jgi:dipeptidyl aminopeptidase/acylaminoacyl peptidase
MAVLAVILGLALLVGVGAALAGKQLLRVGAIALLTVLTVGAVFVAGSATASRRAEGEGRHYALMRADFAQKQSVTMLVSDPTISIADMSPNRRQILFERSGSEFDVANADGTSEGLVAAGTTSGRGAWSPDGSQIALQSWGACADGRRCSQIWIVDVRDGSRVKLSDDADAPAWAPDSRRIAFLAEADASGHVVLTVSMTDGTQRHSLTPPQSIGAVTWSPRGDRIAYLVNPASPASAVRVVRLAGGTDAVLRRASHVAWSPSGARIAFVQIGQKWSLQVARADGTHRRVIDTSWGLGEVAWAPRGDMLAYVKELGPAKGPACCNAQIFVRAVDHARSLLRKITSEPKDTSFEHIWWAAERSSLFFTRRLARGEQP